MIRTGVCTNCGTTFERRKGTSLMLCDPCRAIKFGPKLRQPRARGVDASPNATRNAEIRQRRVSEGLSLQELGEIYRLSRERIRQICGPCAIAANRRRTDARRKQVAELFAAGLDTGTIAKQLGSQRELVTSDLRALGHKTNGKRSERLSRGLVYCNFCQQEKPLPEFSKSGMKRGLCRSCNAGFAKRRYWRIRHGAEPPAYDARKAQVRLDSGVQKD